MENMNILVLGTGGVGKTSCIKRYIKANKDNGIGIYHKKVTINEKIYNLNIYDDGSEMTMDNLDGVDGILLIFSITAHSSFDEALKIRQNIVKKQNSKIPLFLLGNKRDLEDDRVIDDDYATKTAASWGSLYFDTSALDGHNVRNAFELIAREIPSYWKRKNRKQKKCCQLL